MEGGANVISEALAVPVPVLASRISGSIGLLGQDYPGYFPVGDTWALAQLLEKVEHDAGFYRELEDWCRQLLPLVHPDRERESWCQLLEDVL
jgi:glycosyltransferase involved in cell wall biosynthesis